MLFPVPCSQCLLPLFSGLRLRLRNSAWFRIHICRRRCTSHCSFSLPRFLPTARTYLTERHFLTPACQKLYQTLLKGENCDLLTLAIEDQTLIDEILHKKINRDRAETHFLETVQKLLDREWMQTREAIKIEIHSSNHSEEKILELAKQFDSLKSQRTLAKICT